MSKYVPGQGPHNAALMVVGEAPGSAEDAAGAPFVGPPGQLLDTMLKTAGIAREAVYVTNVVKYQPPSNDLEKLHLIGHSIDEGLDQLWSEIDSVNPNAILALGDLSLQTLTGKKGIKKWRGSILESINGYPKIIPSIHPANLLEHRADRGTWPYSTRAYMQLDFNRAVEESKTKEIDLPRRILEICRNSGDLSRFLRQYEREIKVSVDLEVIHCIPICIGLAFNRYHAMSIPLVNTMSDQNKMAIPEHDFVFIWQLLDEFFRKSDLEVIGQNFKFDHGKMLNPLGLGPFRCTFDTMLAAAVANPEFQKDLQFLTSILTREPYYKDEYKEYDVRKDSIDRVFLYNAKDAVVTYEIMEELTKEMEEYGLLGFFNNFQMQLHDLYMDIEAEGVLIDEEERKRIWDKYTGIERTLESELFDLVQHPININSPKQVGILLYHELKLPLRAGTGEDTLVALMVNSTKDQRKIRIIELILELRRVKKTKGTYIAAKTDFDGRMRTQYRISGTETGRTSTSKLDPPVRPVEMGLAFQTITKHGDIGADIRRMFIPDPGYIFMEIDLSQAEARVVALLADDDETLKLFETTDIHKLTATWLFDLPYNQITKEFRTVGKTTRHAGNYDMGKRRLMQSVMTAAKRYEMDIKISEWKSGQILDRFHQYTPKIRGVYHVGVRDALEQNDRVLITPMGRRRQFFDRWGDSLFKEAYAYIPQSTIGDKTKLSALELRKRLNKPRIIMEAHDSLTLLVKYADVDKYYETAKEVFESPINFSKCTLKRGSISIPCEVKIGDKNLEIMKDFPEKVKK